MALGLSVCGSGNGGTRLAGVGRPVEDLPGALGQQLGLNAVDGVCGLDLLGDADERWPTDANDRPRSMCPKLCGRPHN
jgi:hypothetical protein